MRFVATAGGAGIGRESPSLSPGANSTATWTYSRSLRRRSGRCCRPTCPTTRRCLPAAVAPSTAAAGTLAGTALAIVLNAVYDPVAVSLGVAADPFPLLAGAGLALGAMVGDIGASFLKRRTGRERGAAFPGLDQLDFVVGALLVSGLFAPSWTLATFDPPVLVAVLVLTPLLHVVTNAIAYVLGLKSEPW